MPKSKNKVCTGILAIIFMTNTGLTKQAQGMSMNMSMSMKSPGKRIDSRKINICSTNCFDMHI
ncbi:MAG: hypothetical protein WBZ36_21135 [Candidatus Nitrosopolaris sp.]